MESTADLAMILVVVAVGSFAGGILFWHWFLKKLTKPIEKPHVRVRPLHDSRTVSGPDLGRGAEIPVPLSGKFQPTANRIGLSNLIRQMEEDDPEAKRHEQIMAANGDGAITESLHVAGRQANVDFNTEMRKQHATK